MSPIAHEIRPRLLPQPRRQAVTYDVRDLNFDETMELDSVKEHFCPNDACRSAFDAANVLGTFNAKNVRWGGRPDDSQLYFQLLLIYPCVSLVVVR